MSIVAPVRLHEGALLLISKAGAECRGCKGHQAKLSFGPKVSSAVATEIKEKFEGGHYCTEVLYGIMNCR